MGKVRGKNKKKFQTPSNLKIFWENFLEEFLAIGAGFYTEAGPRGLDKAVFMIVGSPYENKLTVFLDQDGKNSFLSFDFQLKGIGASIAKSSLIGTVKNHFNIAFSKAKMRG